MVRLVVRRLLQLVPLLLGLSFVVFAWVRALPGGPATTLLGLDQQGNALASGAEIDRLYGLDRPLYRQYLTYLDRLVHLDLGQSISSRQPVTSEIRRRFPATVELAGAALVVAVGAGVPAGYFAARHRRRWFDHGSLAVSVLALSVPVFFLGFLLKYLFVVKLGWLPGVGRLDVTREVSHPTGLFVLDAIVTLDGAALADALRHLVLPGLALGVVPMAFIARITRASVLDVLDEDYVRTARASGLTPLTIARRCVLRNALPPVATVVGLTIGALLSGAVLVEVVFAWGGMGSFLQQAITDRDYPVLQGVVLLLTAVVVVVNLAAEVAHAALDPRIRDAE
jgi:peptide/nickel transport system permease protein